MKKWLFILLAFAALMVTGCASPSPTAVPTMVTEQALNTVAPPTVTETAVLPTATLTQPPTNTPIPPTATPTPTPAPPFTEGYIALLWDPEGNPEKYILANELTFVYPGASPDEWHAETILMEAPANHMFTSPEHDKIALVQYVDANNDGQLPSRYGGDTYDIDVYTTADSTLHHMAQNINGFPQMEWLSNMEGIYTVATQLFAVNSSGVDTPYLLVDMDIPIWQYAASPDGQQIAIHAGGGTTETGFSTNDPDYDNNGLYLFNTQTTALTFITDVTKNIDLRWSMDGRWLSIFPKYGGSSEGYILDSHTLELTIITVSNPVLLITWSPDSRYLAFTQDEQEVIIIWETETGTISSVFNATTFSEHASIFREIRWSPDSTDILVTILERMPDRENDTWNLVKIAKESGSFTTIFSLVRNQTNPRDSYSSHVSSLQILSYSPDGKWIMLFADIQDSPGIYILSKDGGDLYLVQQTRIQAFFNQISSRTDREKTRMADWLPNLP